MANLHVIVQDLHHFFRPLLERSLVEELGWPDFLVTEYLTKLLVNFSHVDRVPPITHSWSLFGDFLPSPLESSNVQELYLFEQEEDEFHRHRADVILFSVGLFPDTLCQTVHNRWLAHHEILANYMEAGGEAYHRVSQLKAAHSPEEARLFDTLSKNFVLCAYGIYNICEKFQGQHGRVFEEAKKRFSQ